MYAVRKQPVAVYVDRASGRWVVRDHAGDFWQLPHTAEPWRDRVPYSPGDGADLESVPGHYKYLLGLPA